MAFLAPAVTSVVIGGATVQTGAPAGLPILLVGSAPIGPAQLTLVGNHNDGANLFGSSLLYSDTAGWSIPGALDLIYANQDPNGLSPQVYVMRAGTVPATGVMATLSSATAAPLLGGSSANGTTVVSSQSGAGAATLQVITITPPIATGVAPEVFNYAQGSGSTMTYTQLAALISGSSKLVTMTINAADAATLTAALATLATLAAGTDGANSTIVQINTGLDAALYVQYGDQPISVIVPLYSDTLLTAGATAVGHALSNAISMITNGNQRAQVIASVGAGIAGVSTAATVTSVTALATSLNGALDNAGDSGRCTLFANYAPNRVDPSTGVERQYPGWAIAAAYAGLVASLNPSTPRGRRVLIGFTRFAEGYTSTDIANLINGGVNVARKNGKLVDQVTTANSNSYKRGNSIQTQEDVIVSTLQGEIDALIIEIAAGSHAAQFLDNFVAGRLISYASKKWLFSAAHTTKLSTMDQRQAEVDLQWSPIFDLRNVTLKVQLVVPVASAASTTSVTF